MTTSKKLLEVLLIAFRLGVTSFGGPIAHIGYFREEYVNRRQWLDDETYADIVALCQILPGPTSSQVGIVVGISRAGIPGGLAAWIGFTMPSAIALMLFALGVGNAPQLYESGWIYGLKIMAVAIVALAIWGMAQTICTDKSRTTLALISAILMLSISNFAFQISVMAAGALIGLFMFKHNTAVSLREYNYGISNRLAIFSLASFMLLLLLLPVFSHATTNPIVDVIDSFYRTGSLVFGGGHVVLPLLQAEVVNPGWVSQDIFLGGYGAAQAVPGPLFTFAAYLGVTMEQFKYPIWGGLLCLFSIYAPSFLLITGILPYWSRVRSVARLRQCLAGLNSAVLGFLIAALYDPIWTNAISSGVDLAFAIGIFCLISIRRWPIWTVVLVAATMGTILSLI